MSNRRRKEPAASNNYSDGPLPNLVHMLPCLGGGDGEGPTMKDLERRIEKLEEQHEETQKTLYSIDCGVKVIESKLDALPTKSDLDKIIEGISSIQTSTSVIASNYATREHVGDKLSSFGWKLYSAIIGSVGLIVSIATFLLYKTPHA